MPLGMTQAEAVMTISSGHWADENHFPPDVRQALLDAKLAHIHVYHHLAPGCAPCMPGQVSNGQYPDQTDDLEMAIAAAEKDPRFKGRVAAILGGSGGANLAFYAAAKGWVGCAVGFSPATDLPLLIKGGGIPGNKAMNYAPTEAQQLAASPVTYLQKGVSVPTFTVFAAHDAMPSGQLDAWNKATKAAGIENESHVAPVTGHSWALRVYVPGWIDWLKTHIGTPSPTPTASPSATPSATPAPSASPSPTPIPVVRQPHGIVYLTGLGDFARIGDNRAWTNEAAGAVRLRTTWDVVEPQEGVFNFGPFDAAIAKAKAEKKQLGVSLATLFFPPDWLIKAGVKIITVTDPKRGDKIMLVPWDPIGLAKQKALIAELGKRYDGAFDYIAIGGLGQVIESRIAKDDATIAQLDSLGGLAAWEKSSTEIVDAYAAAFKSSALLWTAARPYPNQAGNDSLARVVNALATKYPNLGVMNAMLKAAQGTTGGITAPNDDAEDRFQPNALVKRWAATRPCGLQFLTSEAGFGGHDLGGPLNAVLDRGVEILGGRGFIEAYPDDLDKPENTALFQSTAAQLTP